MPIYEYKCTICEERFEIEQSMKAKTLTKLKGDDHQHALKKVFSAVGISFKGSGFYKNDSGAKSSSASTSDSASSSSSDSSSGSSSSDSSSDSSSSSSSSDSSSSSSSSAKKDSSSSKKKKPAKSSD